jgi:hypothetical protein
VPIPLPDGGARNGVVVQLVFRSVLRCRWQVRAGEQSRQGKHNPRVLFGRKASNTVLGPHLTLLQRMIREMINQTEIILKFALCD